jgi:hypothetical protein
MPLFRAVETPLFAWWKILKRESFFAYLSQMAAQLSVDPSSTISASKEVNDCRVNAIEATTEKEFGRVVHRTTKPKRGGALR